MSRPRKMPKPNLSRCDVCGALRPDEEFEMHTLDVGERFDLEGNLFFAVNYCRENQCCRQQAEARAEAFKRGELVTVQWRQDAK